MIAFDKVCVTFRSLLGIQEDLRPAKVPWELSVVVRKFDRIVSKHRVSLFERTNEEQINILAKFRLKFNPVSRGYIHIWVTLRDFDRKLIDAVYKVQWKNDHILKAILTNCAES